MRTAIFVDFDNIMSGLRSDYPEAVEGFGTAPDRWLTWFSDGRHLDDGGDVQASLSERRVLLRRCYLNPAAYGRYRLYFTRAGFEVVDCPPLTQQGKSGADIAMVMHILDALRHDTRFDEFIILSGDADFTPVLQRLRAHDRVTTVLVNLRTAAAYRSAADVVVEIDDFIEQALGIAPESELTGSGYREAGLGPGPAGRDAVLGALIAYLLGRLPPGQKSPINDVDREIETYRFRNAPTWRNRFGFDAPAALWDELMRREPRLVKTIAPTGAMLVGVAAGAAPDSADLRARIVEFARQRVAEAPGPIQLATLAHAARGHFGDIVDRTAWAGEGTFKALLALGVSPSFALDTRVPGAAYDPTRHVLAPDSMAVPNRLLGLRPELAAFIKRISLVTGAPSLPPEEFGRIFRELTTLLAQERFNQNIFSAVLRDRLLEEGPPVSRTSINFVLQGLRFAGFDLDAPVGPETAATLQATFKNNVLEFCRVGQLEMTEADRPLLDEWFDPAALPGAPATDTAA